MSNFFHQLEDSASFFACVKEHFEQVPQQMNPIFECTITVDQAKLEFAHNRYLSAVKELELYIDSADPDHFKRAGALLWALHKGITLPVDFGTDWEEVEAGGGPLNLHRQDVETGQEFRVFFAEYSNEMLAFMFAFQACDSYEEKEHGYDFAYLQNICAYLRRNSSDLNLETCFIIFRSLMENACKQ